MKIYGPYTRKDGRKHIIKYINGKRITQSYPRYLMEQHLGRELLPEEEVDHIDNDVTNNDINNLQLLTKSENVKKEYLRSGRTRALYRGECLICGNYFEKYLDMVKHNRKQGKAGPFCSRSCAGKYGTNIQNKNKSLPVGIHYTKYKTYQVAYKGKYVGTYKTLDEAKIAYNSAKHRTQ